MRQLVWSNVDRCIFLEDDIIPSISFFRFCAELLEHYKDDQRIECICGMNHLGRCDDVHSDYFFARQGSIWGTATWRRVAEERGSFEYAQDPYVMRLLNQRTRSNRSAWRRLKAYSENDYYDGHVPGSEFWVEFDMYSQNRLQIIPKVNLVSNVGCTNDSEHSDSTELLPKGIQRVFNMNTYEIDFPIIHAKYIIPDIAYEKKRNRIMGYNYSLVNFMRKTERAYLLFKHRGITAVIKKLYKKNES